MGLVSITDNGAADYTGKVFYNNTTTVAIGVDVAVVTYGLTNQVTNTAPFVIGNTDFVIARFSLPMVGLRASDSGIALKCNNSIFCEDVFSAYVDTSAVVVRSNLPWLTCTGTTTKTCTFTSGMFTVAPVCNVTSVPGSSIAANTVRIEGLTSAQLVYTIGKDEVSDNNKPADIICQKTGVDFIGRRSINGWFNQYAVVASKLTLSAGGSQTAATAINFNTQEFNYGLSCTSGRCTILTPGIYRVTASGIQISSSANIEVDLYKNGVLQNILGSSPTTSAVWSGSTLIKLVAGDIIDLRLNGTQTLAINAGFNIEKVTGNPLQ